MSEVTFLQEVCKEIVKQHGVEGLKDVSIVIPSQRVAIYVREELTKQIDSTFWMPEINPINQFLEGLHNFTVVDDVELIFELYEAYRESFENPETLDSFLSWSSMIVSDFNEIDKYLLDANQVFKNLQSIKDIESWSFNQEELSKTQENFLKFWEQLGDLYFKLNERLAQKGECTAANIYRNIAENPIAYLSPIKEKVYFVGFNALSKAEEMIMKYIVSSGNGEVFWDADDYYLSNPVMEAGRFIRKYRSWSNNFEGITSNGFSLVKKQIGLYPANSNLQQVAVASTLLNECKSDEYDGTAVVFADESLLKPMLNVLPDNLDKLNVAMGYPLNASSIFSFFEEIVQVQLNIERYKNKGTVYYKDFLQITGHEIFQLFLESEEMDLSAINQKITYENYAYLPVSLIEEELGEKSNEILFLLTKLESIDLFFNKVVVFLRKIYELLNENVVERESLVALLEALDKLLVIQGKYAQITQISTMNQLSRQLLSGLKVSFMGEPLEGVQVLGLLETRALDFKRVVLVSCNEEILPKKTITNSVIPYDLRVYLGLPTKDDREAIFAYYFYRLLQRAEKVDLIYNSGTADKLNSTELSRYVLQLQEEISSHQVELKKFDLSTYPSEEQAQEIPSEEEKLMLNRRVLEWMLNGVSASGINQFNECPKNFFFGQLLRLSQNEGVEEDIEASTYGTIVHEVLEVLYGSVGKLISEKEIERMLSSLEEETKRCFDRRFPNGNYLAGKNLLMYETAIYTMRKYIRAEKSLIKEFGAIQILGLERKYEKMLKVQTSHGQVELKIKGSIDRIDKVGDKIRVIDYKTGKLGRLTFDGNWDKANRYVMQLLVYLYLFEGEQQVACGMISFKELSKGFQNLKFMGEEVFSNEWISGEFKDQFEAYLAEFAEVVLSSDFQHNSKSQYCIMC